MVPSSSKPERQSEAVGMSAKNAACASILGAHPRREAVVRRALMCVCMALAGCAGVEANTGCESAPGMEVFCGFQNP